MVFNKFLLIIYLLKLIISQKNNTNFTEFQENCLNVNDGDGNINLNNCTRNINNNNSFHCCLVTITYTDGLKRKNCLITNKNDKEISQRIELLQRVLNVKYASIDCSSSYLIKTILFLIFLAF